MSKEFPDYKLPEGWVCVKLKDAAHINMGQSPPSNTYNSKGVGIPFFQGKSEFGSIFPTVNKFCSNPLKIAEKGEILISVRAPIGPTNIATERACIGRGLASINGYGEVSNKYIFYFIRSIEESIVKLGTGTTFKAISKNDLENLPFLLPPILEQNRIVEKIEELFSELDNSIATLKLAKNQLLIYRQVLLNNAFEGKLTEKWRRQNSLEPAKKLLEQIRLKRQEYYNNQLQIWESEIKIWETGDKKQKKPIRPKEDLSIYLPKNIDLKENGRAPKGWEITVLGNIGKLISGQHILEKDHNKEARGVPYLTGPSDFGDIHPKYSKWSQYPKVIAYPDDILITVKGSGVGKINMMSFEGAIGRQLMAFKSYFGNKWFIYYYLLSKAPKIQNLSTGTAIPGIDRDNILSLSCPLVSYEEQDIIVQEIHSQFSLIENLEKTIAKSFKELDIFRQTVLSKAFEGALIPREINSESTIELLEKIKNEKDLYLQKQRDAKKTILKKVMKKKLIDMLGEKFENQEFTFTDIQKEISLPYDELKKQLFELIEKEEHLFSFFNEKKEQIVFNILK